MKNWRQIERDRKIKEIENPRSEKMKMYQDHKMSGLKVENIEG